LQYTGLQTVFPDNVNLLTLEPWNGDDILVRYEHFYEQNDDPQLSMKTYAPTQVSKN
jgi:Glycosyl hydrolases family 38 C-terminal beta sandwich domain